MRARFLLSLSLLLSGCSLFGGGATTDEDDLEAAPPEPLSGPQPIVLFAVHSANVVVPLACRDVAGTLHTSRACLDWIPEGEVLVQAEHGRMVPVADRTSVQCPSGRNASGFDLTQSISAWPVVTWSPTPVPWCPFEAMAADAPLDADILGVIQHAAAALDLGLEPPQPNTIRVEPRYRLDLDGDGQLDIIVRAIWPDPPPPDPNAEPNAEPNADPNAEPDAEPDAEPPEPEAPQQELLVAMGGYQVQRFALPLPELVEITGALDLNDDGRCELVVAAEREDGSSMALGRWNGRNIELVTAYECGL